VARPTISVITPVHPARIDNGMLARALGSVHSQTLKPDAIHIAVDVDGEGAPPTRDRALRSARSDWVAFLDSDDLFMPRHLELLLKHAMETGADYVYSWFKVLQQFPDGTSRVLEGDPIFPVSHYLNPFDPDDPIETTVTTLVRTELAQQVGFQVLDRGGVNTGEDRRFTLECLAAGGKISHLVRKTWLWCHHQLPADVARKLGLQPGQAQGNTSGMPTKGDAANS
jgi:glycosyltransferase involved in cell wall biosynthesis